MKRLWLALILLAFPAGAKAQIAGMTNYCTTGATKAVTQGLGSTNTLQGVIPFCTVSVYVTGTTNLATIYSNSISSPLSNPFTAGSTGQFTFFAASGGCFDITMSGGMPTPFTAPVTLTSVCTPSTAVISVSSFAQLQAAVTACGGLACFVAVQGVVPVTANYTIPTNVTLAFQNGQLAPVSGVTLTLSRNVIVAGAVQIFSGAGVVTGLSAAYPEWFGTKTVGPVVTGGLSTTTGGVVVLQNDIYTSGYLNIPGTPGPTGTCLSQSNISIQGAGMPSYNSLAAPTAYITGSGSIIRGGFHYCGASNFKVSDVGFDVGSGAVSAGFGANDGFVVDGLTESNPADPLAVNVNVQNVSCLNNSNNNGFHCMLLEHISGLTGGNIAGFFGTHGVAIKSNNVSLSGLWFQNCGSECTIVKGDSYTQTTNVLLSRLNLSSTLGQTSFTGLLVDAENTGTTSNVLINGATITGFDNQVQLVSNSTVVAGLTNITLSDINMVTAYIPSVNVSCLATSGASGGTIRWSNINNSTCVNATGAPGIFTPTLMSNQYIESGFTNWKTIGNTGGTNPAQMRGNAISINGWQDLGNAPSGPAFTVLGAATSVSLAGYTTDRAGASLYTTDGLGGIFNTVPYAQIGTVGVSVPTRLQGTPGVAINVLGGAGTITDLAVQSADGVNNNFLVNDDGTATVKTSLSIAGGLPIVSSNTVPRVGTPTVGQTACVKATNPVVIGFCTSVVTSGGACTCN